MNIASERSSASKARKTALGNFVAELEVDQLGFKTYSAMKTSDMQTAKESSRLGMQDC